MQDVNNSVRPPDLNMIGDASLILYHKPIQAKKTNSSRIMESFA